MIRSEPIAQKRHGGRRSGSREVPITNDMSPGMPPDQSVEGVGRAKCDRSERHDRRAEVTSELAGARTVGASDPGQVTRGAGVERRSERSAEMKKQ